MADPAFLQITDNIMSILAAGMNTVLEQFGAPPLPDSAFLPVVQGDPKGDTICAAYSGADREPETRTHRDNEVVFTINIWAFGANDRLAMKRGIQLEAAAIAVLDTDANRYLDGACSQPIGIGNSRCVTAEDQASANLMWRVAFPIFCPVRTSRPETA